MHKEEFLGMIYQISHDIIKDIVEPLLCYPIEEFDIHSDNMKILSNNNLYVANKIISKIHFHYQLPFQVNGIFLFTEKNCLADIALIILENIEIGEDNES